MKVWPPSKQHGPTGRAGDAAESPAWADLSGWLIPDEKYLVEGRFRGDAELYRTWRDRLWTEMHDVILRPGAERTPADEEEYVVTKAFDGDWAQYRVCRDRLREELWQIMKAAERR